MGRRPCCSKEGLNKGAWTVMEDKILMSYINCNGEGKWRKLPERAGLKRCGKSCRLRWLNYLRPDIKRGNISEEEEDLIIRLHNLLGNRWSLIAGRLPGRTDNEIKNYWNTTLAKRVLYSSHHSNPLTSKSKGKSPMTERPSTADTPPTPIEATDAFEVIRPKATRCTRAFFTLDQRNNNISLTSGKTTDPIQRKETFLDGDFLDDREDWGSLQPYLYLEEDWQLERFGPVWYAGME